ncbi:MAG: hypothetical protein RL230_2924, partial [Pseudomonadota bacterium]
MPKLVIEVFTKPKAVVEFAVVSSAEVPVTGMVVLLKAKLMPVIVILLPAVPAASPKETA